MGIMATIAAFMCLGLRFRAIEEVFIVVTSVVRGLFINPVDPSCTGKVHMDCRGQVFLRGAPTHFS